MRRRLALAVAVVALLVALAGPAAAQLPSPFMPTRSAPGFVVAEITVRDQAAYRDYAARITPLLAQYSGRFLVRGGRTEPQEGAPPAPRVVVIQFPTMERARAFVKSADYQALAPARRRAADTRLFLVEGVAP